MTPVDQTTFGFPGGNCFSACVASLLDLQIDDVPYFGHDDVWWDRATEWLAPHGLWPLCVFFENAPDPPPALHILTGRSPREPDDPKALHSVVARGDDIIHDPHPSRAGLFSREEYVILVPLDPRKGARRPRARRSRP